MAKKTGKKNSVRPPAPATTHEPAESVPGPHTISLPPFLQRFNIQALLIAMLAFACYINTICNESALDDRLVITQNEYVYRGLAGIRDILTKDSYDSYAKQFGSSNPLPGGRYRPLSIVTFAIEQQFFETIPPAKMDSFMNHTPSAPGAKDPWDQRFATEMHVRHLVNVLLYALSVVVFLYFLREIVFRNQPVYALVASIIFAIHPIHTEVVANVKSRDEIFSLLFILITFIFAFRYHETRKKWMLVIGLASYCLALLSKEYGITLLVLLPLAFIIFKKETLRNSIVATVPYGVVAIAFAIIRSAAVAHPPVAISPDVLNDPYLFATGTQKIGTEIAKLFNYLQLLLAPYPLSADYSYNAIPYVSLFDPAAWLSLLAYGGIIWGCYYFYKKKHLLCFAIACYLLPLLLISNLFFDIGATMGERLVYHSSAGFAIAVSYILINGAEKIRPSAMAAKTLALFVTVLICVFGYLTITRNKDWKNEYTLFSHDLQVVPNSALVNANVAASLLEKADKEPDAQMRRDDLIRGISLAGRATAIHKTYVAAYLNKSLGWLKLGRPDSALASLETIRNLSPGLPVLPEMYYRTGLMFYSGKKYNGASFAWKRVLEINPGDTRARNGLQSIAKAQVQQ